MIRARLSISVVYLLVANAVLAQWSTDPSENTRVVHGGLLPQIISDGNGGAYIVYQDTPALLRQLWVQRLDRHGYVRFPENGIRVSSKDRNQTPWYFLVSDGAGGVIVVFEDFHVIGEETFYAVYAQRIDSTGTKLWGDAGVEVSPLANSKAPVSACSDGEGGVFVFWGEDLEPYIYDPFDQLWVQRVSADGYLMWPGGGVLITDKFTSFNVAISHPAVSDGEGGTIIQYYSESIPKLQRISSQGHLLWNDGREILRMGRPKMIPDGYGGAIRAGVRLVSGQGGYHQSIRAQRVAQNGEVLWGDEGVTIEDLGLRLYDASVYLAKDYAGGAIVGLFRRGNEDKGIPWIRIVARISKEGDVLWKKNNIGGQIVTDANGNSISFVAISDSGLFLQRLDSKGQELWNAPVLFRKTVIRDPKVWWWTIMTTDCRGGVITAWPEIGVNSRMGIFAQQVSRNGNLGEVLSPTSVSEPQNPTLPRVYLLHQSYPNPFNSQMVIKYQIPESTGVKLLIFDINGKEVIELVNKRQGRGKYQVVWNGKDRRGGDVASGIYLYQLRAGSFVQTKKALFIK